MLNLKCQYFGHLMQRVDSLAKTLMLGKTEGKRTGQQIMRYLDSITDSMDTNLSKLWEIVKDNKAWHVTVHGSQRVRHDWTATAVWTLVGHKCGSREVLWRGICSHVMCSSKASHLLLHSLGLQSNCPGSRLPQSLCPLKGCVGLTKDFWRLPFPSLNRCNVSDHIRNSSHMQSLD